MRRVPATYIMSANSVVFGEIAVALKLLTREQLNQCLLEQRRRPEKRIGEICVERGWMDHAGLQQVLAQQEAIMQRRRAQGDGAALGAVRAAVPKSDSRPIVVRERSGAVTSDPRAEGIAAGLRASRKPRLGATSGGALEGRLTVQNVEPAAILEDRNQTDVPAAARETVIETSGPPTSPGFGITGRDDLSRVPTRFPASPRPSSGMATVVPTQARPEPLPEPHAQEAPAPTQTPAGHVERSGEPALGAGVVGARPGRPAVPRIDRLLRRMIEVGASDLHLSVGSPPIMRVHGKMQRFEDEGALSHDGLSSMLLEIIDDQAYGDFVRNADADFAHTVEGLARFRANYFVDRHGVGAVFRQIPIEILTPDKLGLPQGVLDLCWLSKGLVLVTGPTGSGKSTTLAALIDFINRNRDDHIITIEDPIEFVHENKRCLINQREVGRHTRSFKAALRAALREDPDVILVGELRDLETIAIALETAETGHLVFGTLHTTTAPSTVDRLIDQFPGDQQAQIRTMLGESLRGVIGQTLLRRKTGGRVAAYEILLHTAAIGNLIREAKTHQLKNTMQVSKHLGMQTLNDHLLALVKEDLVDAQEAYVKAVDKQNFRAMLEKSGIAVEMPAEA